MSHEELTARMAEAQRRESSGSFAVVSYWRDEYRAIAQLALMALKEAEKEKQIGERT